MNEEIKKLKYQLRLLAGEAATGTFTAIVIYDDLGEEEVNKIFDVFEKYAELLKQGEFASRVQLSDQLKAIAPKSEPSSIVYGLMAENRWEKTVCSWYLKIGDYR